MPEPKNAARRHGSAMVALASIVFATAGLGQAQAASALDGTYENALLVRSAKQVREIWLNRDGSYVEFRADLSPEGDLAASGYKGSYVVQDKPAPLRVCLNASLHAGPVAQDADCLPVQPKATTSWSFTGSDQQPATASWRQGRSKPLPMR